MFVTLLAVIVALALGHAVQPLAAALRRYGWYAAWIRWLHDKLEGKAVWRSRPGLALAVLPPLVPVIAVQAWLYTPFLNPVALVFGVAMLFYCWGPRDLDLDVEAVMQAPDSNARRLAAARLWTDDAQPWPHGGRVPPQAQTASLEPHALIGAVFRNALRRWFGPLFWFLLLGPVGALGYRLLALSIDGEAAHELPPRAPTRAARVLAMLDWPVAQLMTLAMALVGDFDGVRNAWRENGGARFDPDADFLCAAGRASVRSELADDAQDYVAEGIATQAALAARMGDLPELRDAMSLAWRILVVWLALIALCVVLGWVGAFLQR